LPSADPSAPDFFSAPPAALEVAGPGVILSYIVAAFIAYTVSMALGELASMHPAAGSFGLYGELYLNQYLGFLCRAAYWAAIAFSIGAELVASATYMAYWFPQVRGEIGYWFSRLCCFS